MSALAADVAFDFSFMESSESLDRPATPSFQLHIDDNQFPHHTPLLELPYHACHVRSSSKASSIYSAVSTVESTADSVATRFSTPPRASPPIRQHGPILLPKIRSQDQELGSLTKQMKPIQLKRTVSPRAITKRKSSNHTRSQTNPETLSNMALAHLSSYGVPNPPRENSVFLSTPSFFGSSFDFQGSFPDPRRASTYSDLDVTTVNKFGYPTYQQIPFMSDTSADYGSMFHNDPTYPSHVPRASSPLSRASSPEDVPSTTLLEFLTSANSAPSLVRTVSFPLRDPNIKHFWWDVRNIKPWTEFNASTILNLPGAFDLLNEPVPASLLPQPNLTCRYPETEASLHSIFSSLYLPKLNAALAITTSSRTLQLSVPTKLPGNLNDLIFVANAANDPAVAAAMFGGKPSARVVGIVRTFDRFNTGMRTEGNIKRVEYLRGLAALHHAMREHNCRYGFILTEIELVVVRNGVEATPFFGELDVTSLQLAVSVPESELCSPESVPLTACLGLWGLCQFAGDDTRSTGEAYYKSEIGAPAEGTRRKARPRDAWIPQPQLAEKREAKRSRGWVWPEDTIGRKEMGKRGVKYGMA